MALSQIQCLDDNHVNPRNHESKPEFLYCENQRLALEALLRDGREEFVKFLGAHDLRGFLSDPELETLAEAVEPYDPGSELFSPENVEDDEPPLSLQYWPELSDTSIPQMDLSWLENISYRGVTRTSVYTQPPLEGQVPIKEVVRKMIAQAQKVIAVVMDVFTDVDIFRDLLDAGFRRKVSVYILLERTTLPHFQSMCQRANMHAGHLKNLRVRCTDGAEFYTRSCTKVRGQMGHRFMFIDGDKAVSGSYSFTWTSSRLDKNLITVVTGQAVEAFDRLFCVLYATSSSVDLRQVAIEIEPEVEPLPQPVPVTSSADMARKLYSPKYAMLGLVNPSPSAGPKETEKAQNSKNPETKKERRKRVSKEAIQEDPPIHPGLTNLEKVCMMSYLPTWPEPDPSSDIIGFINIRDPTKPNQVHLQRSEMFGTSQAVRFSSPFSMPKEILPDVATLRQVPAKHEETNKLQPAQDETKTEESVVDGVQPTQLNTAVPAEVKSKAEATGQKSPASGPKSDTTKTLNTENKQHSNSIQNTPTEQDAHKPRQPSSKACTPDTGSPSHSTRPLPGSNAGREAETNSNTQRDVSNGTQAPHLHPPTDSDTERQAQTKTVPPCTDSAVNAQPRNSREMTPNAESPTANSHTSSSSSTSVSSSSLSENSHVSTTTSRTIGSSSPLSSSSIPPTTPNPPLPSSSAGPSSASTPPIPKPRTVQLVFTGTSDGQKLPEFSVVRKPETSTGVHDEPAVVHTSPENVPEIVPELQRDNGGKTGSQKDVGEAPQHKPSGTSRETKTEEADGRHAMQLAAGNKAKSDVLITDAPKAESVNIQEIIPTDVEPKTSTSTDCQLTQQIECVATVRTEIKAPESSEVPNETSQSASERKTYLARAHVPQRISYSELTPHDVDVPQIVDSLKAPTHTVFTTHTSKYSTDAQSPRGNLGFTPACVTDGVPKAAKHNTHGTFPEQIPKAQASTHTPARPLHLHLSYTHETDFRSPTSERESRSLSALLRTPTPDGFLPRTPTPDSRTHTPDPRTPTPDGFLPRTPTPDSRMHTPDLRTPDFQTPTFDGYNSPRTDSALSTASEEYYECNNSPLHEPVFDRAAFRNHGTTDDHVGFTHANTPNATTITRAATSRIADRSTSISETESLSGPASGSSSSSLKEKMGERNVENGREEDESGERMTEEDYQETERRGSEDVKRTADHFKHGKDSTGTEEENKEAQSPKRKRVLSQSAAGKPVDAGVTPAELANERTDPWRLSTGDLQLKKSPSQRRRPDMEKAADRAALGPSGAERRDRPPSTGDTDGQKILHTPLKTSRGQQRDIRAPSPSRQSRPPQTLTFNQALGLRPRGSRHLNQAESKVLPGSVQSANNTSSPRRSPSRTPPPARAGDVWLPAGRERAEAFRQPPQGRTRAGPAQNQHPPPKPEASQNQTASPQEAHRKEDGKAAFSLTFSKLYSLKDLKEKMGKLPVQSKTDSASAHVQGRKSSS